MEFHQIKYLVFPLSSDRRETLPGHTDIVGSVALLVSDTSRRTAPRHLALCDADMESKGESSGVCSVYVVKLLMSEIALAAQKSIFWLLLAGSLSSKINALGEGSDMRHMILKRSKVETMPENKDDGESDEEEGDDDEDSRDDEEDDGDEEFSGEEGNDEGDEDDDDNEPNGGGGSEEEDDDDDDDGDDDDNDDEDVEDEEDEDEEEHSQPPSKKKK